MRFQRRAKGGQHHHYTCLQYLRAGKDLCSGVRVPKRRFERFAISRVRDTVLEEEHLNWLTSMVNKESAIGRSTTEEKLENTKRRIGDI